MPLSNPGLFKQVQNYEPVYGGIQFGGEENATTLRPSSTALFCISSADRYKTLEESRNDSVSPYRFTITKQESLLNGFFTRMALTELRFPWTLPNVSRATYTNRIGLNVGADTAVIDILISNDGANTQLDDKWLSPTELAAAITARWNYLYPANTIAMSVTDALQFQLTPVTAEDMYVFPLEAEYGEPSLPANTYQLFDMMNWTNTNVDPQPVQFSGVGYNLLWTNYIDIVSNNLTYNQALKDSSSAQTTRDIIYRIYLTDGTQPFNYPYNPVTNNTTSDVAPSVQYVGVLPQGSRPFMVYRQFSSPKEIRWNKQQPIGQCTFEVYDDKGRCLADLFPPNTNYTNSQSANWDMTMLVSEN